MFHELENSIDNVGAAPTRLTICKNTSGYGFHRARGVWPRVVKAGTPSTHLGGEYTPLPKLCILVAFQPDSLNYLLASSIDGSVRANIAIDWMAQTPRMDWRVEIVGLHSDCTRQQLFVAQPRTVWVTMLTGDILLSIPLDELNAPEAPLNPAGFISAIAGDANKLWLLDRDGIRLLVVVLLNGEAVTQTIPLDLGDAGNDVDLGSLTVHRNWLYLCDNNSGRVFRVCSITNNVNPIDFNPQGGFHLRQLVAGTSHNGEDFIAMSDFCHHSVAMVRIVGNRLLLHETRLRGFRFPAGLASVPADLAGDEGFGSTLLVLADFGNRSLRLLPVNL